MEPPIQVTRPELFTPGVDEALASERALRRRLEPEVREVSTLRRILLSSYCYYPVAGVVAAILAWTLLDRFLIDYWTIGGEIEMVNRSPMPARYDGEVAITISGREVLLLPGTRLEPGADGQPPFSSIEDLRRGDTVEAAGNPDQSDPLVAIGIRPATTVRAKASDAREPSRSVVATFLYFPGTAALIALGLLLAEGLSTRNWIRLLTRTFIGTLLAVVFCVLATIPAGFAMTIGKQIVEANLTDSGWVTAHNISGLGFVGFSAARSVAWSCLGAGLGVGINLVRSSRGELVNSVVGGTLGGALGGLFFDPIDRFFKPDSFFADASASRLVGMIALGLCIGLFVALVEQLSKDAWLRVRTGPLAGKAFILYRTPTVLGSAPGADIYLFKDAEIAGAHAAIHRLGSTYEIEHVGKRGETVIGGLSVRRRRLVSGDQIVLGGTVLHFEERARRSAHAPA